MKHAFGDKAAVSRETLERLEIFVTLLLRWNGRINLVSQNDEQSLVDRHINDALQLVPLMPHAIQAAIDLGSGGGFPGLILAIASGTHFNLIESDKRKSAFLREAIRATNAAATVHAERVEHVSLPPAPLLTARAFAPLPRLLELAERLIAPGAILLLPKGENVDRELTAAKAGWNMRVQKIPSQTHPGATILRLSEVSRA